MKYLGIKLLQDALPMNLGEYNELRGWDIPADENPEDLGYMVKYTDEYVSWSPKDAFEAAYMKLNGGNTITQKDVDDFITKLDVHKLDSKTTLVKATLRNGFVIVEASSCVDPANFDLEIGKEICLEKIKNQVWGHLGFSLQTAINGLTEVK